ELVGVDVPPKVAYRIRAQRAGAYIQLERFAEGVDAARSALDIEPEGREALILVAQGSMWLGDLKSAELFAQRGVGHHADDPTVWGVRAEILAMLDEKLPEPSPGIAAQVDYLTHIREIAARRG